MSILAKTFTTTLLAMMLSGVSGAAFSKQPNIVLVFLDNFGWGEPGFNGGGIIRGSATPRLDKLAGKGLRLTNFIVYMGNEIYGVKWRNWKINFKEMDSVFSETVQYGMPRVYNLLTDPQERENVLFPNTWVPKAALGQLGEHAASLQSRPPIKPGTLDPYKPAK